MTEPDRCQSQYETPDDDDDYEILGDASVLTRNGKATATEGNKGKGTA